MQEQTRLVAMRIRELREIAGLSQEETAAELKIPEELYSQYEKDGKDIPISVIYSIANLYRVDTTDIISGLSPKMTSFSLVRRGKGIKVERFEGYEYENIAYSFLHRKMEPMIVTLSPGGSEPKMVMHKGQEINFCLKGSMKLYHDGSTVILNQGDCAYFDASKPHGQSAEGSEPAAFLTVINEI